jgi:hypothetical protein
MELDIAAFYGGVSVARLAGPPFEDRQQSLVLESEKESSGKRKFAPADYPQVKLTGEAICRMTPGYRVTALAHTEREFRKEFARIEDK